MVAGEAVATGKALRHASTENLCSVGKIVGGQSDHARPGLAELGESRR